MYPVKHPYLRVKNNNNSFVAIVKNRQPAEFIIISKREYCRLHVFQGLLLLIVLGLLPGLVLWGG